MKDRWIDVCSPGIREIIFLLKLPNPANQTIFQNSLVSECQKNNGLKNCHLCCSPPCSLVLGSRLCGGEGEVAGKTGRVRPSDPPLSTKELDNGFPRIYSVPEKGSFSLMECSANTFRVYLFKPQNSGMVLPFKKWEDWHKLVSNGAGWVLICIFKEHNFCSIHLHSPLIFIIFSNKELTP